MDLFLFFFSVLSCCPSVHAPPGLLFPPSAVKGQGTWHPITCIFVSEKPAAKMEVPAGIPVAAAPFGSAPGINSTLFACQCLSSLCSRHSAHDSRVSEDKLRHPVAPRNRRHLHSSFLISFFFYLALLETTSRCTSITAETKSPVSESVPLGLGPTAPFRPSDPVIGSPAAVGFLFRLSPRNTILCWYFFSV